MDIKKIAKIAVPLALAALPLMTLAVTLIPPDISTPGAPVTLDEVQNIIQKIANFLIVISVILAVIFIIWGAVVYITAHGGERTALGKKIIWNGIIGAAVVLGIGVILNTLKALLARTFFG